MKSEEIFRPGIAFFIFALILICVNLGLEHSREEKYREKQDKYLDGKIEEEEWKEIKDDNIGYTKFLEWFNLFSYLLVYISFMLVFIGIYKKKDE